MKAIVLCGGMPQIELIKELKHRGIETLLVDMNPKAIAIPYADKFYQISTLDYKRIKELVISEHVNFLFSVCADQMILVVSKISEELGLPCYIGYETAKNVSNKEYMKKIFVENQIPTSKYLVKSNLNESDIIDFKFPLITKPVDAYSSKGVRKVYNYKDLKKAFEDAVEISRTNTAIVEEFVGGFECTVDVYVEDGKAKVLSVGKLDKIPEDNKFIICRSTYPSGINTYIKSQIEKAAQNIAEAFKLKNTPMLIQLKVDGDKISVIEFCARTGGGIKYKLISWISGFDVIKAVVDLTLGKTPHVKEHFENKFIINEFCYCKKGVLDKVEGFEELLNNGIITDFEIFKPKGYNFGDIKSSGDRVAYFSIQADNEKSLIEKHKIASNRVRAWSDAGIDLINHEYMAL